MKAPVARRLAELFGLKFGGKIPAVDGLRALSIIAVMGFHAGWPGFIGGGRGVDLFYVISGYLIAWLLLKEKDHTGVISLKNFYRRRILRIVPAYCAFLLGYTLICATTLRDLRPLLARSVLIAGLFATDIMIGWFNHPVLVAHTWSISVEEHFYLLYPLVLAATTRRQAVVGTVLLIASALCWRMYLFYSLGVGAQPYRFTYGPDARLDTILFGCLIALLTTGEHAGSWIRRAFQGPLALYGGIALVVASIAAGEWSLSYYSTVGHTVTAAGFSLILLFTIFNEGSWFSGALSVAPLQFIGRLSFSLYLWHTVALAMAEKVAHRAPEGYGGPIRFGVFVAAAVAAASLSLVFVEQPFLKKKEAYAAR